MAACGLQPGRKNSLDPLSSSGSNGIDQTLPRVSSSAASAMSEPSLEPFSTGANASVMARFAAAMMRTVKTSSQVHFGINFQMRIGSNSIVNINQFLKGTQTQQRKTKLQIVAIQILFSRFSKKSQN